MPRVLEHPGPAFSGLPMKANGTNDSVAVESIDLDQHDLRPLTCLTGLENYARAAGYDDHYLIVSQSGWEYIVNGREDAQLAITEHVEPPDQGGEPYFRCEGCGRQAIGRNEDRIILRGDCPRSKCPHLEAGA